MTAIDFRTDPVTAQRHRVVSLVTHADIQDIVWADQDRQREEVTMPDCDNAELWERTTLVISEERAAPRTRSAA